MLKSKNQNWLIAIVFFFVATVTFAQNLQISGGNAHTVAICESGDIYAWGKNDVGQLGPGVAAGFSNSPQLVTGFPVGLEIRQTDAGSGSHTLALGCDGSVYAWGTNENGQLGNGATGGFSATPVKVVGIGGAGFLSGVKYVSGGNDESFAIMNDGRLVSWGQNDKGQLGNSSTTNRNFPNYVLKCGGGQLGNVIQVEAGDENCYALLGDGTVWSWGDKDNNAGAALGRPIADNGCAKQVVYGDNTDAGYLTTTVKNIVSISAGDRHVLMLDANGNVWTFGGDWGAGQLGQGKGYQYSAHKVLAPKPFNSPWTTDPYIIDKEYNTGPYLEGVTSISAGQAHSMAVLADGSMVTWGANGFYDCGDDCAYLGGQLGIGMTLGIKTGPSDPGKGVEGPVYGLTSAGVKLKNVVSVSDGDAISIAVLANGDVYIAGSNSYGQAGTGSGGSAAGDKSGVLFFKKIIIPSCTFVTPCAEQPKLGQDITKCASDVLTLDARVTPRTPYNYIWEYSIDGITWESPELKIIDNIATRGDTIKVRKAGYYRVTITDDRAVIPANCSPCPSVSDIIQVSDLLASYADPGDLTFCGATSTVNVTESGTSATTTQSSYAWYKKQTGGVALATTIDEGTATLDPTTLGSSGTAPNRIDTVWVEDKSTFTATIAKKLEVNASNRDANTGPKRIDFAALKGFSLNSIQMEWVSYYEQTTTLTLKNSAGVVQATGTSSPGIPFVSGPQFNVSTIIFSPTITLPPGNYYIESTEPSAVYNIPGNAYSANFGSGGIDVLDILSSDNPGVTTKYAGFFDWNVTAGSPYPCGRVRVLIKEKCPPCSVPVSITAKSKGNGKVIDTICVGSKFAIQIDKVDTTAKPSKKGYYYYWAFTKTYDATLETGTGYSQLTLPKKLDAPNAAYADYAKATSVGADSGFYFLVIQDGPGVATPSCKDSAVVQLRINKAPTTKALIGKNQEICYNDKPADLVQTKPSVGSYSEPIMYKWFNAPDSVTASSLVKLTPKTVGLAIAATSLIANTYYVRQDSVSYCPALKTNFVKIKVNNKPVLGVIKPAVRATLCEGENFNLSTTIKLADSSGTHASLNGGYYFTWMHYRSGALVAADTKGPLPYKDFLATTRASVAADSGTYLLIVQDGKVVSATSTCGDTIKLKIVIQKPYTAAAVIKSSDTICSGSKPTAFTEKTAPTGAVAPYKYQWYSSTDSFKVAGNTTKITSGTLIGYTESNNLTADKYYVRIDSSGYCSDTTNILTIRVRDALTAGTIAKDTIICKSGKISLRALTVPTGGQKAYTYKWEYSKNATPTVFIAAPGAVTDTFYVWDNSNAATQLGVGTYNFRRTVTDNGVCGSKSTATVSVQITDGLSQAQPAKDTVPVCSGAKPLLSAAAADATNATAPANLSYKWQIRSSVVAGVDVFVDVPGAAGPTALTYQVPTALTSDTLYRRISAAGTSKCDSAIVKFYIKVGKKLLPGKINKDTTICKGATLKITNKVSPSGGGSTNYTYVWKQSTASAAGPYTPVSTSTSTIDFTTPPAVNDTTWYVREVSEASCGGGAGINSDTIKVSIYNLKPGTIGFTTAATDTTICSGGNLAIKGLTVPTNGKPAYTYTWTRDNVAIAGTDSFYTQSGLAKGTYIYNRITKDASGCATQKSNAITVYVKDGLNQNILVPDTVQTVCYDEASPAMNPPVPEGGTGTGAITYQWFVKNGVTFIPVAGQTSVGYTPSYTLQKDTFYVRRAVHGITKCDTAYFPVHIKVRPEVKGGNLKKVYTACPMSTITLTDSVAANGGGGVAPNNFTYAWEISRDGAPFEAISGTGVSNSYIMLLKDSIPLQFRRLATNSVCGPASVTSDTVTVSVNNLKVTLVDPKTLCVDKDTLLTAVTNLTGALNYVWTIDGNPASGSTNTSTYTYKGVFDEDGKELKVEVSTAGNCKNSAKFNLQIVKAANPLVSISTLFNPICKEYPVNFTAEAKNEGGGPTYQWYVVPEGSPAGSIGNPVGSSKNTFSSTTLNKGDSVYVLLKSNLSCALQPNPVKSNTILMDIRPTPTPSVLEGDTTICAPKSIELHAVTTTGNTVQWYYNGSAIEGETNTTIIASKAGDYSVQEDNGACNAISTATKLTVIDKPIANAGPDQTLQEGEISNLTGTGGETYLWSPATYLSSTTVSDPSFKATKTIPYTLVVKVGECPSDPKVVTIFVVRPITVPNVITVNGDGVNDTWEIENIEGFPNVIIEIYNRWGNLVWKTEGYPKNWDGTNFRNGEVLPDGTYFYIINLKSDVYPEPKTGWVQIMK